LRNFSQSFVKIALYGVVGSERTIKRVWDTSQQANLSGKLYGRVDLRKRVLFSYAYFYHNDWFKTVDLANQCGYIPFYKGGDATNKFKDTYQYDDSYYKTMALKKIKLTMNLSIKKMEPLGGFLSHLATLFRVTKGTNIRLGVFGHVYKLTESVYQIKPYAVWRG
jgi:hypothetical protein